MPLPQTLGDLQAYGVNERIGIPACDPRFIQRANQAQKWLSEAGQWYGSIAVVRICVINGCITFPRRVATVEKFDICVTGVRVRNNWYEFEEYTWTPVTTTNPTCPVGGCSPSTTANGYVYTNNPQVLDRGTVCTNADVGPGAAFIQLYASNAADVGKQILLQGTDGNGNPIFEYVTLTVVGNYAQSVNQFVPPGLTSVQKPITAGNVVVVAAYPANGTTQPLGFWEPSERYPNYVRKFLTQAPTPCGVNPPGANTVQCFDNGNGCSPPLINCAGTTATTLCRLEFVPALVPTDWMFIQNLDAVQDAMVADFHKASNEPQLAEYYRTSAIRTLRNELDKYQPPSQISINSRTQGSANLNRLFAGMY